MVESAAFQAWFTGLRDLHARLRIYARLVRFASGNVGDVKHVGFGVCEVRIHCGPGYRVYFQQRGARKILLLCGGDKHTQAMDIKRAISMAQEID